MRWYSLWVQVDVARPIVCRSTRQYLSCSRFNHFHVFFSHAKKIVHQHSTGLVFRCFRRRWMNACFLNARKWFNLAISASKGFFGRLLVALYSRYCLNCYLPCSICHWDCVKREPSPIPLEWHSRRGERRSDAVEHYSVNSFRNIVFLRCTRSYWVHSYR